MVEKLLQGLMLLAGLARERDLLLLCNRSTVDGGAELDAVLQDLEDAAADGRWAPRAESEGRRQNLLPQQAPLTWEELMHEPAYHQALSRLP